MSNGRRDFQGRGKDWAVPLVSQDGRPIPTSEHQPTVICAWCECYLRGDPAGEAVSHGICPDCKREELDKLEGLYREIGGEGGNP